MVKIFVFFINIVMVIGLAHAEVYVWKDATGKTVYSDKPPAGGAQVLNVNAHGATPASSPKAAVKTEEKPDVSTTNAKIADQNAKIAAQNAKVREQHCKNAQNNLTGLQQNGRVRLPGTNELATDAQRAELLAQAQKDVEVWCSK